MFEWHILHLTENLGFTNCFNAFVPKIPEITVKICYMYSNVDVDAALKRMSGSDVLGTFQGTRRVSLGLFVQRATTEMMNVGE